MKKIAQMTNPVKATRKVKTMRSTALERSSQKILLQPSSRRKLLALASVNKVEKRVM